MRRFRLPGSPALRRILVTAVVLGGLLALMGVDLMHSIYVALGVSVLGMAIAEMFVRARWPRWLPEQAEQRGGTRLEVASLAWSLLGRGGRVGENSLRKLREIAAGRLARHGLSLDDPRDREAIGRLLGEESLSVLISTGNLPARHEIESTIKALERADPWTRPTPTALTEGRP